MSAYTSTILKLGLLVPASLNLALLGGLFYGYSQFKGVKEVREKNYKEHVDRVSETEMLEKSLAPRRARYQEETKLLKKDLRQEFAVNLAKVVESYTAFELQQVSVTFPTGNGPLDAKSNLPKTRMKVALQGGYGPMQEAFFRMENLFPQLVLEKMSIATALDSFNSDGEHLDFTLEFMGWQLPLK